jgi:hypothetical protein
MAQTPQERANAVAGSIGGVLDRDSVVATQQAMMGDGQITTLNGATSFSSQASCGSDAHYLSVNGSFNVSGLNVNMQSDTDLDGVMDASYSVSGIHGVCTNGYFKCASPSTATGCSYYEWVGHPLGDIHRTTASEIQNLYNCRCIDASCDPNSATYLDRHLETVGSGMVQNYQRQNPYFAVSDVTQIGSELQFHGRVSTACSATAPDPSLATYYNNPETMASGAAVEQSSNHYFAITSNSTASVDTSVTQSCSIIRDISLTELEQDNIIQLTGSNNASISSCGPGCINVNLGSPTNDTYNAIDGCTYFNAFAEFDVLRPDLITNVSLLEYMYDDKIHIDVNDSTIVSREGFLKTQPEPSSCEMNHDISFTGPAVNMTSHFTSAGIKRINSTVAVGGAGNQYARFRIRFNESDKQYVSVAAASQGRNNLTCNFDLTTGVINCISDGTTTVQFMDTSIPFDDACGSGASSINLISSVNNFNPNVIWPGAITGPNDDTVNYSYVGPTCANGLQGSFSVTDLTTDSDPAFWLGRSLRYEIETTECLVNNTVIDSCAALTLNDCTLRDHAIDGTSIISNFSPTGNVDSSSTQIITDGACNVAVTEDYFIQNKNYSCPSAPPTYSVDMSHLQAPSFSGGNMTITTSSPSPSNPIGGSLTMPIPELPADKPCAFQCKVKRTSDRNQVNTAGNETNERDTGETTEIFTRPCENSVCPLEAGETIVESCGCLNEFAQVAAALEVLKLAGKDIVCVP